MAESFKGGYLGRVLNVDLSSGEIRQADLDLSLVTQYIGGRGFTSRLQYNEVSPEVDPLSPDNILVMATGPLTGIPAPATGRFTAGGRSPLTGILGDANCGGFFGPELKLAGYDMLVFRKRSPKPVYLWIDNDHVEIRDASHVWGKDTTETEKIIKGELGDDNVQIATIGQAGENLVRIASIIINLDHALARTGIGALMGSRNLKAVIVRGTRGIPLADASRVEEIAGELMSIIMNDKMSGQVLPEYGTTSLTNLHNDMGIMATRNWQTGVFEGAHRVDGDAINRDYLLKARACYACPCRCDRYTAIREGEFGGTYTGGPEYFTVVSFGSKCGNDNLASIIKANELCNRYGLDTASTGSIIAFAMECFEKELLSMQDTGGLDLTWGDYHSILQLVEQIAFRRDFGAVLADGILPAAKRIGKGAEKYAMHAKGQDLVAPDPRGLKVYNFRYAVASRGGDHLRISAHGAYGLDALPLNEAAQKMKFWQDLVCLPDLMGLCKFVYTFYSETPEVTFKKILDLVPRLFVAATALNMSKEDILRVSERVAVTERAFNSRLGLTREDDVLPRRFHEEPMPEGPKKGQVMDILEPLKDHFYEAHGWDKATGIPTPKTLEEFSLKDIADDLKKRGIPIK